MYCFRQIEKEYEPIDTNENSLPVVSSSAKGSYSRLGRRTHHRIQRINSAEVNEQKASLVRVRGVRWEMWGDKEMPSILDIRGETEITQV
jgi:hypothetical protein